MNSRTLELISKHADRDPAADQNAAKGEEGFVNVGATLAADAEALELVQPADGSLDDPARRSQSAAVRGSAVRDDGLDVPLPQLGFVRPGVVRAVRLCARRAEARASALALERRDGVDEREELGDVMIIRTSERDHQRDTLRFGEDVMLAPGTPAIRRVGTRLGPPFSARTLELSITARDQSISPAWCNSVSNARWICFHAPAACQSRSRRQQVTPEPQPISLGKYSHGMPVCSTKMIPVSAARSGTRGRPVRRTCPRGKWGSIKSHSASSTSTFAIVGPPCPSREATTLHGPSHPF
jgi:hypothetical protein